ncbi:MAG: sugar dehydratase, partial [Candidatus Ryanbacteria bacterium]|nr:sugar dehydratase [Candidatus Ryanbacteria bacterium]
NFFGGGDLNWRRIVPATMRAIFLGEKLRVPSASAAIRDCFYVEDAALAYMMLAEKMSDKSIHGQAFNFGAGMPTTVLDLALRIIEIAKSDVVPDIAHIKAKAPLPSPLDMRKAENILGWSPSWTLEAGISKTLDWYRDFFQK